MRLLVQVFGWRFLLRAFKPEQKGRLTQEIFTHSLARPGARFFFAVCAAVDIHSLTGASGGDSLTHWRVRGRVFFFAPCAAGEIHSLTGASAAVCGWNRGRVFFFAPCAAGEIHSLTGASAAVCG